MIVRKFQTSITQILFVVPVPGLLSFLDNEQKIKFPFRLSKLREGSMHSFDILRHNNLKSPFLCTFFLFITAPIDHSICTFSLFFLAPSLRLLSSLHNFIRNAIWLHAALPGAAAGQWPLWPAGLQARGRLRGHGAAQLQLSMSVWLFWPGRRSPCVRFWLCAVPERLWNEGHWLQGAEGDRGQAQTAVPRSVLVGLKTNQ